MERAAVRYARALYNHLDIHAQDEVVDGETLRVWRGNITETYLSVVSSKAHYKDIQEILFGAGCIEEAARGTRNQDTVYVLRKPIPDAEKISVEGLTFGQPRATLRAEVERRLSALESWRETIGGINIAEALRNHEQRLAKLEANAQQDKQQTDSKSN